MIAWTGRQSAILAHPEVLPRRWLLLPAYVQTQPLPVYVLRLGYSAQVLLLIQLVATNHALQLLELSITSLTSFQSLVSLLILVLLAHLR